MPSGDVSAAVTAVTQAGAVGVNLEDRAGPGLLFGQSEQADRLAAARAAADRLKVSLWINARTDVFLTSDGSTGERLEAALERASAYATAGANSLFVPGLIDLDAIAELAGGPLPVAVMVWAGAPPVNQLASAGAVRISLGSAIAQAAFAVAARAASELLDHGTYDSTANGIPYGEMNDAMSPGSTRPDAQHLMKTASTGTRYRSIYGWERWSPGHGATRGASPWVRGGSAGWFPQGDRARARESRPERVPRPGRGQCRPAPPVDVLARHAAGVPRLPDAIRAARRTVAADLRT